MNGDNTCPYCAGALIEHQARDIETEEILTIYYCDDCQCDWIPVGFDEWVSIDPLWPYNVPEAHDAS